MRQLLPRHLFFSLLAFLLLLSGHAWSQACEATIRVEGRAVLCQGETTVLRGPSGTGLTYQWLRDGVVQTDATGETYEVSTAGRYQVRVSGTDCTVNTSSETEIAVNPRPNIPNFVVTPTTAACAGTPLTFSINAPQENVVYTWAFGDGNTARGPEVQYAYDLIGVGIETFDVEVFGTSTETGCESEVVSRPVQVRPLPEISFSEENNFLTCLPDTIADADISVTAIISNDIQEPFLSDIRSYFVDWGDGSAPVQYRPSDFPISNPNPYTAVGDYTITISAVAGNGCTEPFTQVYSVSKEPKAGFSLGKKRADEQQQPPCIPVIVTPEDSATGGGLTYVWSVTPDQGYVLESGSLTEANPVFRFTESGVYTIEQIVTNGCDSDTASQGIVVGWPQVQPPTGGVFCGPTRIDLSASGPGGFPGGGGGGGLFIDKNLGEEITVTISINGPKGPTTQTFNSETFTYAYDFDRPGTYTIAVEAVNECGSSNAIFQGQPQPPVQVVILQQPGQPTIANPGIVCEGDFVELTPTSTAPSFAWFDTDDANAAPIFIGDTFVTPPLPAGNNNFYVAARDSAQGVLCTGPRRQVTVTVNPRVTNNVIDIGGQQTGSVCIGGVTAALTGSRPSGGDETTPYSFTWLISTAGPDRGFAAAPGVNNNQNYTPTEPINANTWFRRVVRSANCSPDSSNVLEILAVDPVPPSANVVTPALQEICTGDEPGQLVGSQPSGGAGGPYTYRWEISTIGPDAGFVPAPAPNNGENYSPSNLVGNTWFRRVVTSGSCDSPSEAVRITVSPAIANNTITTPQQDECAGGAPATITGSAPSGGNGNYTYEWQVSTSGATGNFTPAPGTNNQQSYTPGSITQTTWFRRVVRAGECTPNESAAVEIRVRPAITDNSISAPQEICSGTQPVPLTGSSPAGGSGGFTFRWESSISGPTAGFNPAAGTNTGATYSPPALTRDTWFRRVAISGGCENPSEAVLISILPLPTAPVLTVRDVRACLGGPATLTVANAGGNTIEWYDSPTGGAPLFVGTTYVTPELTRNTTFYVQAVNDNSCVSSTRTAVSVTIVTPQADAGPDVTIIQGQTTELRASGGVSYEWEPATGLSNPNVFNPVASPEVTTTYTVTVTTEEGCTATDEVTITVIPAITAPNAFSPNGDRVNDVWEIENIQNYPDARVEIFNRWGNQVFSSTGYGAPWDGTYRGEALPVATYYYIIYLNSSERPISGHVTIIR